jgi:hypothetical protein
VQKRKDADDSLAQSQRAHMRQEDARQAFRSPGEARERFDELWRHEDQDEASREQNNRTGFISIKTNLNDQKVSIFPAARRFQNEEDSDQWGKH